MYSFDHVAVNEDVLACDMSHVPLEDETLDVAIFSLLLMGANVLDYVREAHRMLKTDGHMHIMQTTSRLTDRGRFVEGLKRLGFDVIEPQDMWKFTHIHAIESARRPYQDGDLTLG